MRLFRRDRSKPLADEPVSDEWQVHEGEHDGKPLLATFRTGAKGIVGSPRYSIQIGVAVPLLQPTEDGLPGSEELAQLVRIEDTLTQLVDRRAVFVGVITTGGMREFVLYAGSGDWIAAFDADLRAALPSHQVQVMAQSDPKWSVYRQFVRT